MLSLQQIHYLYWLLRELNIDEVLGMIVQMTGLSGAGKTTIARMVKKAIACESISIQVIDGDDMRNSWNKDLGFSKQDREVNIRRLASLANIFSSHGIVAIISAINPYENIRSELTRTYDNVLTVYVRCDIDELKRRDTKGLYYRALLPNNDAMYIHNLTGINDKYDYPPRPDLEIDTTRESRAVSVQKLVILIKTALHGQSTISSAGDSLSIRNAEYQRALFIG